MIGCVDHDPRLYVVRARNLPEHARNPIHTDAGAQAAGFPRALVAGVTTYAYLTHPLAAAWGLEWIGAGGGEVRFRHPVFEHDEVSCRPRADGDAVVVEAHTGEGDDQPRAVLRAVRRSEPPPPLRDGERLADRTVSLVGELGAEYGTRAGEQLELYAQHEVVHPAVWPAIANAVVHAEVARGSWIHLRSVVRHHGLAREGATATVESCVVRRYQRGGERAVLDVHISVEGRLVATLEHEAIVALA